MSLLAASAIGQGLLGLYQSANSGAEEATKDFENFAKTANPLAKRSKSIDDYYQQALSRYNENPYQSQQYQLGAMNARRSTASGFKQYQDRHSALAGAEKLSLVENSALQNLGGQAENRRDARFGAYGQAAQLQNQQDKYLYEVNQANPYRTMLGIKQLKAQAANDRKNAGFNMMGSAFGNYAMGSMYSNANKLNEQPITATTQPTGFDTNIPGSPSGKFSSLSKLGTLGANIGAFKSAFGNKYSLPKIGGLPYTANNYPVIDQNFTPEY